MVSTQRVRVEDETIKVVKTWPEPKLARDIFRPAFDPKLQQDSRSAHFNAQDELINWIVRELDLDSGCGRGR